VEIEDVKIGPGNLVFEDIEGVIAVPRPAKQTLVMRALEKVWGEKVVGKETEAGISGAKVFRKYEIL